VAKNIESEKSKNRHQSKESGVIINNRNIESEEKWRQRMKAKQ
jgi:hypothetical protein